MAMCGKVPPSVLRVVDEALGHHRMRMTGCCESGVERQVSLEDGKVLSVEKRLAESGYGCESRLALLCLPVEADRLRRASLMTYRASRGSFRARPLTKVRLKRLVVND